MRSIEDTTRPGVPTATVVRRVVDGLPELVVVCERCNEVKVISVEDAMRVALQVFLREHNEELHK